MNSNMEKALQAVVRGEKADGRSVLALKRRKLLDKDGKVTPVGREAFLDMVETTEVYTLTLGMDLNKVRSNDGRTGTVPKGTSLVAVYAGNTKNQRWYDCFVSKELPLLRVLHHRAHKIHISRVPKEEIQK